jgi:cytochrome c oxidase cbb3-type subunit 1
VKASYPFWAIRVLGGLMYLVGMLLMLYNVIKTMQGARMVDDAAVPAPAHH